MLFRASCQEIFPDSLLSSGYENNVEGQYCEEIDKSMGVSRQRCISLTNCSQSSIDLIRGKVYLPCGLQYLGHYP